MGLQPHKPRWDEAKKLRFVTAWNYGVEIEHLAERFGVDERTLYGTIKRLKKEGYPIERSI